MLQLGIFAFILLICGCAVLLWKYGKQSNDKTDSSAFKMEYSLPSDLKCQSQSRFVSGDKMELELSFQLTDLDNIQVNGKLVFYIKEIPEDDFQSDFFLDCYVASRPLRLVLNDATQSQVKIENQRLGLPRGNLKIGKNELHLSYTVSSSEKNELTLRIASNDGIAYYRQGLQAFCGLMPCIDHPSVEIELSSSFVRPSNKFLVATSLGEAFSKTEGRRDTMISNKRIVNPRNFAFVILDRSIYTTRPETYDCVAVDWLVPEYEADFARSLLLKAKDQLKAVASRHKAHFPFELNTRVSIVLSKSVVNSISQNIAVLSVESLKSRTGPIKLAEAFAELLIRSVERKQIIRTIHDYVSYEQFFFSYSQMIVREANRNFDETFSPDIFLTFLAPTSGCLKRSCLIQSPASLVKRNCLKPFFSELAGPLETFSSQKSTLMELLVTNEGHIFIRADLLSLVDKEIFFAVSSSGIRTLKLNHQGGISTGKLTYFETAIRQNELLLATRDFISVNQDISSLAEVTLEDKELETIAKFMVYKQSYGIKQVEGVQYIDNLIQLLENSHLTGRCELSKGIVLEITKAVGHLKLALRQPKLKELSKTLEKLRSTTSLSKKFIENLVESVDSCQARVQKFGENLLNHLKVESLESTLDKLSEFYPLVAEQQDMSKQFAQLTSSGLDEGVVLLLKEAFKARRADFKLPLILTEHQIESFKQSFVLDSPDSPMKSPVPDNKASSEFKKIVDKSMSWELLTEQVQRVNVDKSSVAQNNHDDKFVVENEKSSNKKENSESDKIENILKKLSEFCDSNADHYDSGLCNSEVNKFQKSPSQFGKHYPSKALSMRSVKASQSFFNTSAMSQYTKDSTAGDHSQNAADQNKNVKHPRHVHDKSYRTDVCNTAGKSKKKNGRSSRITLVEHEKFVKGSGVTSWREEKKSKQKKSPTTKFKLIAEDELEYTPKNRNNSTVPARFGVITVDQLKDMMSKWQEEYEAEVKYFIEGDISGIKLKYLESCESLEEREKLLDHIKIKCYKRAVSMYMLMRARKKSDIGSVTGLLLDCGIINQISFPEAKLRGIVEQVVTNRGLNCRFKKSSFIDLLIVVAVERFYHLGEADTLIEVAKHITPEHRPSLADP